MKLTALVLAGLLPMAAALSTLAAPAIKAEPTTAQDQEPASKATTRKATTRRATVIFLRHAEALPRTDGNQNPHLNDLGKARAKIQAKTLAAAGVTRVFATELHRTQETATPLAESLGLKVEQYRASNSKAFANTLRDLKDGEVALVVGHSNTVPVMVKVLGGELAGLDKKGYLPDTQHNHMIVQVLSSAEQGEAMRALQTLDLRIN
jgi:broad specificity phosphatase PhoE